MITDGSLTSGHARAVLSVEGGEMRLALAKKIAEGGLNVRQAEALAKELMKKKSAPKKKVKTAADIETENLANNLSAAIGTKVNITRGAKKGKIEIEYYGNDDLERILNILGLQ